MLVTTILCVYSFSLVQKLITDSKPYVVECSSRVILYITYGSKPANSQCSPFGYGLLEFRYILSDRPPA